MSCTSWGVSISRNENCGPHTQLSFLSSPRPLPAPPAVAAVQHEPSRLDAIAARVSAANRQLAEAASLGLSFRASGAAAAEAAAAAAALEKALRAKDAEIRALQAPPLQLLRRS